MNARRWSLRLLQWTLGLLLGGQAVLLLMHGAASQRLAEFRFGMLALHLVAGTEVFAAALFLIPRTLRLGGWLLILVLVSAGVLHLVLGMAFPIEFFAYVASIVVVISHHAASSPSLIPAGNQQ